MPEFESTNTGCPALKYYAVDSADPTAVLGNLVVTVSGGELHVTPTNPSLNQEYTFKIKAAMEGPVELGADANEELISSVSYNLKVGCGAWTTITADNIVIT